MNDTTTATDVFSQIFDYKYLLDASAEMMAFGEVTMKKDFGPLKKGQNISSLWFNMEKGVCDFWEKEDVNPLPTDKFTFEIVAESKGVSPFVKGLLEMIQKSPRRIDPTSILSLIEQHELHKFDQFVPIVEAVVCGDYEEIKPLVEQIG